MHFFIILHWINKFLEAFYIDKVIFAKLLIIETEPIGKLTRIVTSIMLFGYCKKINFYSLYMNNTRNIASKCKKHYLCNFFEISSVCENSYSFYWWYNKSSTYEILYLQDRNKKFTIDNCWIVLYNLYLTRYCKAHINVEIFSSVQAIKYIDKYIEKSSHCAIIQVNIEKNKIA